jgi:hypothetical protein
MRRAGRAVAVAEVATTNIETISNTHIATMGVGRSLEEVPLVLQDRSSRRKLNVRNCHVALFVPYPGLHHHIRKVPTTKDTEDTFVQLYDLRCWVSEMKIHIRALSPMRLHMTCHPYLAVDGGTSSYRTKEKKQQRPGDRNSTSPYHHHPSYQEHSQLSYPHSPSPPRL